jgi:hypothetical protein
VSVLQSWPGVKRKHKVTPGSGADGRGGHAAGVGPVTAGMGGSWTPPERLAVSSRLAKPTRSHRCMTCGRLSVYDTLLERLARAFQHVACALGQLVQQERAVVRPRHFAGHRHLAAADQADIREGVVGGATGERRDQGGCGWCRGLPGGSAPAGGWCAGVPTATCPRPWAWQQHSMVRTPASPSALRCHFDMCRWRWVRRGWPDESAAGEDITMFCTASVTLAIWCTFSW